MHFCIQNLHDPTKSGKKTTMRKLRLGEVCMYVRMNMCEHPYMGVKTSSAIPLECTLFLDSLTGSWSCGSSWAFLGSLLSPFPSTGITSTHSHQQLSIWALGIEPRSWCFHGKHMLIEASPGASSSENLDDLLDII